MIFFDYSRNVVMAIYIATDQDPAQNIESSNCITLMEAVNDGKDLHISVFMPSIEVGTVGGGTHLPAQAACLNILGVKGASSLRTGANAEWLARVVAGAVMAGEPVLDVGLGSGSPGPLSPQAQPQTSGSRGYSVLVSHPPPRRVILFSTFCSLSNPGYRKITSE